MTAASKVQIIGIGDDGLEGLTSSARELIERADVLLALDEHLQGLVGPEKPALELGGDLENAIRWIDENPEKRVVVLASGDPFFYGTARYLCDRLGKDRFEVAPHVSSMQLAFARVKESWDEAYLTNLAAHSVEHVVEKARTAVKVGLFTTEDAPPSLVAQKLLDSGIDYYTVYVCENLGSPDERVTQGELGEVAAQRFSTPNVMVLVRKPKAPDRPVAMKGRRLFGNPDEAFLQSRPKRGLLTPAEVRTIVLADLDLGPTSIVWDIGAGSGSVAIEAAQLAAQGVVYAIEMDPEDYELISRNAERFGVTNLTPILGKAPEAWLDLPDPDAVFVGGTGLAAPRLVAEAFRRLRAGGRMVAAVATMENLVAVRQVIEEAAGDTSVLMLNIARGVYQLERVRFEAQNPTFLIAAVNRD